jgi:molybdopterin converting factor small subunit
LESRRQFLRWLIISGAGAVILLDTGGLIKAFNTDAPLLKIKVVYNLMARYISTSQENFDLQSPALLRNLLDSVAEKHPSLTPMLGDPPTMMILTNGVPSQPNVTLKDGDQVDFIPLFDGG